LLAWPTRAFSQELLSLALDALGNVLMLSTVCWQSATYCCVCADVGPVLPVATLGLLVLGLLVLGLLVLGLLVLGLVVTLVVVVDDLPHPASNAAPRTASSSGVDSRPIIAAS